MNPLTAVDSYVVGDALSSDDVFIEIFSTRAPTPNDTNYPIQKRWFNTTTNTESLLIGFTSFGGILQAVWVNSAITPGILSFLGGAGTTGFPVSPNVSGDVTLTSTGGTIAIT